MHARIQNSVSEMNSVLEGIISESIEISKIDQPFVELLLVSKDISKKKPPDRVPITLLVVQYLNIHSREDSKLTSAP